SFGQVQPGQDDALADAGLAGRLPSVGFGDQVNSFGGTGHQQDGHAGIKGSRLRPDNPGKAAYGPDARGRRVTDAPAVTPRTPGRGVEEQPAAFLAPGEARRAGRASPGGMWRIDWPGWLAHWALSRMTVALLRPRP